MGNRKGERFEGNGGADLGRTQFLYEIPAQAYAGMRKRGPLSLLLVCPDDPGFLNLLVLFPECARRIA